MVKSNTKRDQPHPTPTAGEAERETDLLETFVEAISVVASVEGQFLLVLWRHGGDGHHASRDIDSTLSVSTVSILGTLSIS